MTRIKKKIKPEIADEQWGFVGDNAIYLLRMLSERSIEVKGDLHLCFIDYTKAFDTVNHNEIINTLEKLNVVGRKRSNFINQGHHQEKHKYVRIRMY